MNSITPIICQFHFFCVLLLCSVQPAIGWGQSLPVAADTTFYKHTNTLLWRISGQGLSEPSYVFGTMHILCPEDAVISDAVAAAFLSSRQVALEIDMDAPNYAKRMMRAAKLPWPTSLRSLTRQRDFRILRQFCRQRLHRSILPFVLIQPMLVGALVASSALPCEPVSYEDKFVELAKVQGKEILGLETIEEQLPPLQFNAYEQQAKSLIETVRSYDSIPPILQRMVATYRSQDVEALYQFATDPRYSNGQDGLVELGARNRNWIPKMQAWMKTRSTFFAVGAAHLGSSNGVLHLLRLQGYQVEPVSIQLPATK